MKRIRKLMGKGFTKAAALVLAIMMLVAAVPFAETNVVEAVETETRTIGILFDNSGSMYKHSDWCRALYAMETFAAMANDGDRILIYPMHAITVGVVTDEEIEAGDVTYYTSTSPLEIVCGDEESVAQIREIYTPEPGETPIESLEEAYDDLIQQDGEKWYLVVTDGYEFDRDGSTLSNSEGELSELLSGFLENLNVMYLGIGTTAVDPEITADSDYVSQVTIATDSAEVLADMVAMSNTIYGRSTAELLEDTLELQEDTDVTILVQGESVADVALTDSDGDAVSADSATYALSYSTTGQGKTKSYYDSMSSDEDLVGVLVIYEDVPAGTYTLTYNGSPDSISVSTGTEAGSEGSSGTGDEENTEGSEAANADDSENAEGSEGTTEGSDGSEGETGDAEGADAAEGTTDDAENADGTEGADGTEETTADANGTESIYSDGSQEAGLSTESTESSGESVSGSNSGKEDGSGHTNVLLANARWIVMGFVLATEIFIILWLVMHQKVFPNRIMLDQTYYMVDGEEMAGEATVEGGRNLDGKTVQITIQAPEVPEQPNLEFGITFEIKPVDYRCVKGSLRRVEIVNITGGSFATSQVKDATIAAREITWDESSKTYVEQAKWDVTEDKHFGYTVGNMRRYRLHGVAYDGDREMEVVLSFVLLHK